jgi:hypothetical protein
MEQLPRAGLFRAGSGPLVFTIAQTGVLVLYFAVAQMTVQQT